MKVLSTLDTSKWSMRRTCNECESELEIEISDIAYQFESGCGRLSDSESWLASCPICHHTFYILGKDIPKAVQAAIKNRQSNSGSYFDR